MTWKAVEMSEAEVEKRIADARAKKEQELLRGTPSAKERPADSIRCYSWNSRELCYEQK